MLVELAEWAKSATSYRKAQISESEIHRAIARLCTLMWHIQLSKIPAPLKDTGASSSTASVPMAIDDQQLAGPSIYPRREICCSSEPPYLNVLAVSFKQAAFCSGVQVAACSSILLRSPGSSSLSTSPADHW